LYVVPSEPNRLISYATAFPPFWNVDSLYLLDMPRKLRTTPKFLVEHEDDTRSEPVTKSIVVLGANGKIGRIFCEEGARAGLPIRAVVRSEEQREFFESRNVEIVIGDLEGEFEQTLDGCDRLVFTAGSGGHTGPDKTMLVDLYGAIRAIEASERFAIDHFVMVSAARADVPLSAAPAMRHYMVAKKVADDRLIASSVDHTILRPGRLTDEPGSGKVRTRFSGGNGFDISRQNVARCIAAALESPAARNQVVDLLDGDQLISTLFSD
jgi:uncharacterized protein YbjT (DUF2867 family)